MTPNLAYVQVSKPHWRGMGLWLPLFLLWIPALLLAPFVLLAVVVGCAVSRINPGQAIASFWAILCALPGTHVRVRSQDNQVNIRIL